MPEAAVGASRESPLRVAMSLVGAVFLVSCSATEPVAESQDTDWPANLFEGTFTTVRPERGP